MLRFFALLLYLASANGLAAKASTDETSEEAFELDPLVVTGSKISLELKKETTLRFIRQALDEPYSRKREDQDKMRCWLETPVGTHFAHLTCARNGDLEALRVYGPNTRFGPYGRHHFKRRMLSDNSASLREKMAKLPDTQYFDNEFIAITKTGVTPPRDIPKEDELRQFVNAWFKVDQLGKANKPEKMLIAAITAEGLSLKRYNRLVALTKAHPSIEAKVTELAAKDKGSLGSPLTSPNNESTN